MATKVAGETDEQRKARQRLEVEAYEKAHGIVPGTAQHHGDGPRGGPAGGQDWPGRARMAAARREAGVPCDDLDVEALSRAERAAS